VGIANNVIYKETVEINDHSDLHVNCGKGVVTNLALAGLRVANQCRDVGGFVANYADSVEVKEFGTITPEELLAGASEP
jgi:hypothetical protein